MKSARRAYFVGAIGILGFGLWTGCAAIAGDFDSATVASSSEDGSPTGDGTAAHDSNGIDSSVADATMDSSTDSNGTDSNGTDSNGTDSNGTDVTIDSPHDATTDQDGMTDAPLADSPPDVHGDGNPCLAAPTTDLYVDVALGSDANTGSGPACPMKTITAALTASAGASNANANIHLAAGTYGSGETFPLVINHGRSLLGAGSGTTKIQGSSSGYHTTGTSSFLDSADAGVGTHYVTLLAGDTFGGASNYGKTTLSGFTLVPDATVTTPTLNYVGVACIAGNAPNTGATPPLPTPSLFLQNLTVGPNFDTGLAVGASPAQSTACNVTVTGSTFTGMNAGVSTGVCGLANPVQSWPSAQIGDGVPSDSNTFSSSVIDIFGAGCGSAQSINHNNFASGYRGIVIVSQPAQYFEILGNTFTGGSASFPMGVGVQTSISATISKLNANTLTNIAQSAAADTAVGGTTGFALMVASVLQAHQNVIHDNDNGVQVGVVPGVAFDFSSGGTSSNANEIYCNAKPAGAATTGYDLILGYSGGIAANFAGNYWDHAPPVTGVSSTTSVNGTDIVTGSSGGATVTGAAVIGLSGCLSGRVH